MTGRAIMLQGTGSNVGKSLLVAGLCRAARRRGIVVMPFKPQNMSNNAALTADGGEIGRAQALQARAAGVKPSVHMNPVLLKPETETGAQIVVRGKMWGRANARGYQDLKARLFDTVLESFNHLKTNSALVIVEGAGSPAEVNLRAGDIANMGFAAAAEVPVVLVGDIDRGGVIAALVGTQTVIDSTDASRIRGFIVNKFRGDISLFDDGVSTIEQHTDWPCLGIVPWFTEANSLPAEDALDLTQPSIPSTGRVRIAVPLFSRIANFDDLDPLQLEPDIEVIMVSKGQAIPGDADLILLPGTKSTMGDLLYLKAQGWDIDIAAHARRGGRVCGLCGGYQMLGRTIADPHGIEGIAGCMEGLGLLNVATVLGSDKALEQVRGIDAVHGESVSGYEIHIGRTDGPDTARPVLSITEANGTRRPDGARSRSGRVWGCYVHGLFTEDRFRRAVIASLGGLGSHDLSFEAEIDLTLDRLADFLELHIDVGGLFALAR